MSDPFAAASQNAALARNFQGMNEAQIAAFIEGALEKASLEEKIDMMSGHGFFADYAADNRVLFARPYRAGGGLARLGVPALYFTDGPRGVALGHSTCFPCTMARGASFDPDLERRVGEAMAIEARAQGANFSGAVCVNLLRHPAWGRAQETYGEDPHLLGEMGAALATGIQTHNVVASVKHFALNSIENARFSVDVQIDERPLHEVYLPHFKRILDAGCASVMSAYNRVNGEYCGQNHFLLTEILREEWGFAGIVHSDWLLGVYQIYGASAGLDIENPEPRIFGEGLLRAVQDGSIAPEIIDRAARRILLVSLRFAAAQDPLPAYEPQMVASPAHIALALEAAQKSAVLLKNDGTLPLRPDKIRKLAVLGSLAAIENTGDYGSSRVRPLYVVTPLQGLQKALGAEKILHGDEHDIDHACALGREADGIVVVVGTTALDEGEFIPGDMTLPADAPDFLREAGGKNDIGGDRDDLRLALAQRDLILAASALGKPLIVVVNTGSAILMQEWHERAQAILQCFYAGMEGGTALARILLGEVSPGGKLPLTLAREAQDYPFFDKHAAQIRYDHWHGYSKLAREGRKALYPFGHGLSYARFTDRALKARRQGDRILVQVSVQNESDRPADEVVQIYVGFPAGIERPRRLLKAFQRAHIGAYETRIVHLAIQIEDLRWRDPHTHQWHLAPGVYSIELGNAEAVFLQTSLRL